MERYTALFEGFWTVFGGNFALEDSVIMVKEGEFVLIKGPKSM